MLGALEDRSLFAQATKGSSSGTKRDTVPSQGQAAVGRERRHALAGFDEIRRRLGSTDIDRVLPGEVRHKAPAIFVDDLLKQNTTASSSVG